MSDIKSHLDAIRQCSIVIEDPMCSFCDERKADGVWRPAKVEDIFVCRLCATEVLPALMADAICIETHNGNSLLFLVNDALERAIKVFWRAMFLALLRQVKGD